jgi:DNA-binding NtrC family response regulator
VSASRRGQVHTSTLSISELGDNELVECTLEIEVVEGPDVGVRITIPAGRASIGAGDDVDLELSDPTVSRRHAELRAVADGVLVIDLGSKNGTRIADVAIKEALLTTDGTFSVGATKCRVSRRVRTIVTESADTERFGEYLTCSEKLKRAIELLRRVAQSEATILIEGETGTGKELLARAVHQHSERSNGPYVVVDCSAITPTLLESHLFGHVKGAYTGASDDRTGAFEAAGGGTVFLDELGELPIDLQPKLLRALESRTVRRVGDVADRPIDVRFVCATNRDLKRMVAEKTFRDDLYYRVAVVRVRVPPLRERPEDIPLLASHYAETLSDRPATLAPETFATLSHYDWPGNARELRNVIQRALALAETDRISPTDIFPSEESAPSSFHEAKDKLIASFEKRYVKALLDRHQGNISRAAKEAGLSRNALYALMKRAGLSDEQEE